MNNTPRCLDCPLSSDSPIIKGVKCDGSIRFITGVAELPDLHGATVLRAQEVGQDALQKLCGISPELDDGNIIVVPQSATVGRYAIKVSDGVMELRQRDELAKECLDDFLNRRATPQSKHKKSGLKAVGSTTDKRPAPGMSPAAQVWAELHAMREDNEIRQVAEIGDDAITNAQAEAVDALATSQYLDEINGLFAALSSGHEEIFALEASFKQALANYLSAHSINEDISRAVIRYEEHKKYTGGHNENIDIAFTDVSALNAVRARLGQSARLLQKGQFGRLHELLIWRRGVFLEVTKGSASDHVLDAYSIQGHQILQANENLGSTARASVQGLLIRLVEISMKL